MKLFALEFKESLKHLKVIKKKKFNFGKICVKRYIFQLIIYSMYFITMEFIALLEGEKRRREKNGIKRHFVQNMSI